MSSKQHKIFGGFSPRGIETVSGRNAHFPAMNKKPDLTESNSTERSYLAPFNGYSTVESNLGNS